LIFPDTEQIRMISVAGAIAEIYWQYRKRVRSDPTGQQIVLPWWGNRMSKSDWESAGCPIDEPDKKLFAAAKKVATLLMPDDGALWPWLLLIARELIEDSRELPDGGGIPGTPNSVV
jgi:hypothetical protein